MTTFAAETKWVDGAHYEKIDGEWVATGVHLERFTNTPRRGEPLGSRDRAPPKTKYFAGAEVVRFHQRANEFADELLKARAAHGPMVSAHEGYAIILEELDEIKQIVWQKQKNRNYDDLRKEVVQLGAMALAFLVEIVDTENRK